jgi:AcrR family transcriptional regulator
VAKATFYAHFASKDELDLAFLERCHQVFTVEQIIVQSRSRADNPSAQVIAIFDVLDEWFHQGDFHACSFMTVMLEMGAAHPLGKASIGYLAQVREFIATLAAEADFPDPDGFARSCHILTKGSIISAVEGDLEAAARAKRMAVSLIAYHQRSLAPGASTPGGS